MSVKLADEIRADMEHFFATSSPEEIRAALKSSGSDFYRSVPDGGIDLSLPEDDWTNLSMTLICSVQHFTAISDFADTKASFKEGASTFLYAVDSELALAA